MRTITKEIVEKIQELSSGKSKQAKEAVLQLD